MKRRTKLERQRIAYTLLLVVVALAGVTLVVAAPQVAGLVQEVAHTLERVTAR